MKVALVDNGSLEPAAHEGLRSAARAVSAGSGTLVEAVSWRHSDRIPAADLAEGAAWTLDPWVRAQVAAGESEFIFVPFFISPQGAIGTSLRAQLAALQRELGGFEFTFAEGLSRGRVLADIVASRVRDAAAGLGLPGPRVVIVDHGGPSRASADVRDRVASEVAVRLAGWRGGVFAASMESPEGDAFTFNQPLLADLLGSAGFDSGDVIIAPLFLLPGRHAGPGGDLAAIAAAAAGRCPALRCRFAELVGSHPLAAETLARALVRALGVRASS